MQDAETWTNNTALRPALAGSPGSPPHPTLPHPTLGESKAKSGEGQGLGETGGLPLSAAEASSVPETGEKVEQWEGGRRDAGGGTAGQADQQAGVGIHSAVASFMTRTLAWQGLQGRRVEARAQSSSWHCEPDQAGPEGRGGLSPLPGNQQRTLRSAEGVDPWADPASSQ